MLLLHPVNCQGGRKGLGVAQKQSKQFRLNPVTQKHTKRSRAGTPPGKTGRRLWWKLSGFLLHLPSAELQALTHSSLWFHNWPGTCSSSPINHYSLLREDLEKAQLHTETADRNTRIVKLHSSEKGTGGLAPLVG